MPRRPARVAFAAAVLIAITGCGTTTPAPRPSTTPMATPARAREIGGSLDPASREACVRVTERITAGVTAFGADLGSMLGHSAGANPSEAAKAGTAARDRLRQLAQEIRSAAAGATDPEVSQAADEVAGNLEQLAAQPDLMSGIVSVRDVSGLTGRVTSATTSLTRACG